LYKNVHFLEAESVILDGVKFIGATLWTDMNKADPFTLWYVSTAINDFSAIRNDLDGYRRLQPTDVLKRHRESVKYITKELKDSVDQPVVVVSHHLPTLQSIPERFASQKDMNGCYASDLSNLILDNPNINLWFHGHTHDPCDYMVGDTRVVCNPRGYVSKRQIENPNWDEFKIIEV
jgi:predicted phosphodiesterase